ncbi:MAG: DUF4350 domain-containing protein [Candidatus Eremiobacteraeota bacterium]|nr:DUF4350 domain-containing protein [Candidatus Eremiobacteraeota bacterium]
MRRKISGDAVWGGAALVLFIILALTRNAHDAAPPRSEPSSYDTGRNGYRALYDVLSQERVPVERFTLYHHFLSPREKTLVMAVSPRALGRNEVVALKDWVRAGGHLIVLAPDFGGPSDAVLGIPATRARAQPVYAAHPFAPFAFATGVHGVAGEFGSEFTWSASPKALPFLASSSGMLAIELPLGKGTVLAITDPGIFGNAQLSAAQNARFAVQLLRSEGAPVFFDETVFGYGRNRTLWETLPAVAHWGVYLCAFAILLNVLGNLVRFAPPLAALAGDERDSSAYITSMANLLARAKASRRALVDTSSSALRAVRRALGLPERTPLACVLAHLQDARQRGMYLELNRLADVERPNEQELIRAGVLSAQLRRDFE